MPDLSKLSEYLSFKRITRCPSEHLQLQEKRKSGKVFWDHTVANNTARHKFIPGKSGNLKGNCSMLKMVVKENLRTVTIYGRTDIICKKSGMVTHANWRRDLKLPAKTVPNKCYQDQDYIIVDLDLA